MSALLALVLSLLIFLGCGGPVSAGQVQELPSQQTVPLPPRSVQPPVTRGQPNSEVTIPKKLPGLQNGTRDIPLPEVFRGCWRGSVSRIDTLDPIDPDAARTIWLTKSYMLCYKQTGYNGRWQLTFAEGEVSDRRQVIDQRQSIRVHSISGPNNAELTAYLHFRARPLTIFGLPGNGINTLDELAHLRCSITPDQMAMDVEAAVFVENNNRPYANITWHTRFSRVSPDATVE
jgi:hypothetical protein